MIILIIVGWLLIGAVFYVKSITEVEDFDGFHTTLLPLAIICGPVWFFIWLGVWFLERNEDEVLFKKRNK